MLVFLGLANFNKSFAQGRVTIPSSPSFVENLMLKPKLWNSKEEKNYSTPSIGNWWHYMQGSILYTKS